MTRKRTKNEVFTNSWTAKRMLNQMPHQALTTTYLEPTAGNGNFLVAILKDKLKALKKVNLRNWCLDCEIALSNIYGIELFTDNVLIARKRMLRIISSYYDKKFKNYNINNKKQFISKCKYIIKCNVLQGNELTLRDNKNNKIKLYKWQIKKSNNNLYKTQVQMDLKQY